MQQLKTTVDQYIRSFPKDVQLILKTIRKLIREYAPEATETISYGMPAYKTNGKPLVYFAAFKDHIGFYATPSGHAEFEAELSKFKRGKGSVQFPVHEPVPYELISRMVQFRLEENSAAGKKKM